MNHEICYQGYLYLEDEEEGKKDKEELPQQPTLKDNNSKKKALKHLGMMRKQ